MGNPDVHYKIMCQKFDRTIYNRKAVDISANIEELEERIRSMEHTSEYYFDAGVIAAECLDEIHEKGDAVNAYIGGLNQFCWLIGLDNEEDDNDESN
jgi:hypothetical protein